MRPRSPVRSAVVGALRSGPACPTALAERAGVDVGSVRTVLDNMRRAGEAAVVGYEAGATGNRPTRVYSLVETPAGMRGGGISWDLIDCWARWPSQRSD